MTADEFLALPPTPGKWELIDGEIVVHDPTVRHPAIVVWLVLQLTNWIQAHPEAGATGIGGNWRMPSGRVVVPDVWFLRRENVKRGDWLYYNGAPDLAIEVRSPNTWDSDRGSKKDEYLTLGAEVWLVDTVTDTVLVFRDDDRITITRGQMLSTPLLPALAIDVDELFDR